MVGGKILNYYTKGQGHWMARNHPLLPPLSNDLVAEEVGAGKAIEYTLSYRNFKTFVGV